MKKRFLAACLGLILLTLSPTQILAEAPEASSLSLNDEQLKAITALNYLTVTAEEIHKSKNSRLFLDNAYENLYNNMDLSSLDEDSFDQVKSLLNTIHAYQMLDVKRQRLQYLYEQKQAQLIKEAIPNPVGLLSAVSSGNYIKMLSSVVYMAVDAKTSYESAKSEAELSYLQDGWALDDEERDQLHAANIDALDYMFETVQQYHLPIQYALNAKSVESFVSLENESNVTSRIQSLEEAKDAYMAYGNYWLVLAKSYYENDDYQKCIDCITEYESLNQSIFRNDYELAQTLPIVIVAANEILDGSEYVNLVGHYVEEISANADREDWSLKFFAAQVYVDLYNRTHDPFYLSKAYELVKSNVNILVKEQLALNASYMAEVKEVSAKKGATKAEKEECKSYNKMLKDLRKTELPPVHSPLMVNCDLLFAIADEMSLSEAEKSTIDKILHDNGNSLFLIPELDQLYWFTLPESTEDVMNIEFDEDTIEISAAYVSADTLIKAFVTTNGEEKEISDWVIKEVSRPDKADLDSFIATYESKELDDYKYEEKSEVKLVIYPMGISEEEGISPVDEITVKYEVTGFATTAVEDAAGDIPVLSAIAGGASDAFRFVTGGADPIFTRIE